MERERTPKDEYVLSALQNLRGYDRLIYQFGKLTTAMSGVTPKLSPAPAVTITSIDMVRDALKNSKDWDTGLSSEQIANITRLSLRTAQRAIKELLRRREIVYGEKGKFRRYWLRK